ELVARPRIRTPRLRTGVPRPRAEPLALLAVRVPASRHRVDARRRRAVSARSGPAPATGGLAGGLRAHVRAARDPALRRSGCRSDLRAVRGRRRTVRRRLVLAAAAVVALAVPGTALAHVTLVDSEPVTQSRVDRPPTEVRLRFNE